MAKIEAWEQRIRDDIEMFANQANSLFDLIFITHYETPAEDGEEIPNVDVANDPKWPEKLRPMVRDLYDIYLSILRSVVADEDGESEAWREYIQIAADFVDGTEVKLRAVWHGEELRRSTELHHETFTKNFVAFTLADWLLDYFTRYKDLVHLGVCRVCHKVYLKPKHGQKMRYCSPAHRQKAYRKRKKEADD